MATHWVCKNDGRIQCQDDPEVTLDEMRRELALIVGDANILGQAKKHVITPKMCGLPAGSLNAYELSEDGYYVLVHGFVGRTGFADCRETAKELAGPAEAPPEQLSQLVALTGLTSAATHPVLVRELIGTAVRVYEVGSPITQDYRPDRTNIVTDRNRIADIWYG